MPPKSAKAETPAPVAPPAEPAPVASVPAVEAVSSPPVLTASQQAAIDSIMAEAKGKAEQVILGGNFAAGVGTPSGNIEDKIAETQRDFLPGKMRKDKTYVPIRIYDENADETRPALLPDLYKYVMVTQDDFLNYRNLGFKLCHYDGGSQSGLAPRGFLGTGETVFTRTVLGYCQRGDVFLMWIPIKGWQELYAEDNAKSEGDLNRAVGSFYNAGYREGIRATASINGKELT